MTEPTNKDRAETWTVILNPRWCDNCGHQHRSLATARKCERVFNAWYGDSHIVSNKTAKVVDSVDAEVEYQRKYGKGKDGQRF